MGNHLDEMAKAVASAVTRREAIRRFGGGLAGAVLAAFGLGKASAQAPGTCPDYCRSLGLTPGNGNAFGKCVSNCARCRDRGGHPCGVDACCFDFETCCGDGPQRVCCHPDAECCRGNCIVCPEGTELNPETCECERPCCRGPGFVCDGSGAEFCGSSGPFGVCACFSRLDGSGECGEDDFCSQLAVCASDADCPEGTFCAPNTCCGVPVCIRFCECDDGADPTSRRLDAGTQKDGLRASGV